MKNPSRLLLSAALGLLLLGGCATPTTQPQPPASTTAQPVESAAKAVTTTTAAAHTFAASSPYLYSDAPARAGYPNSWTTLNSVGYVSAYDETFKNPAWVAYHLHGTPQTVGDRQSGYDTDSRTVSKVTAADYPSGYDHGHLAPNQAIATYYGDAAQTETFLMTNMLPQRPGLNRGPWKSEETMEYSKWEPTLGDVWVIAGPVYTTTNDEPVNPKTRYGAKKVASQLRASKLSWPRTAPASSAHSHLLWSRSRGRGESRRSF